ncbi:MAG TPA: sulfatase-like hydrolase/transferase [Microthrixaceae bacterium]|nr:sulfatase-like hydrolase/transferase [Microthrixaceae bacterium]
MTTDDPRRARQHDSDRPREGSASAPAGEPGGHNGPGSPDGPGGPGEGASELRCFLELLALSSVAIAQPLLDVFSKNPSVFVAQRAGWFDVVAFALIVVAAPPVALWAIEGIAGLAGRAVRRVVHLTFVGLLAALFFVQLARQVLSAPTPVLVGLGAVLGVASAVLVARTRPARVFLGYLSVSPVLFLALFLVFSPVSEVAFGGGGHAMGPLGRRDLPPVVMVVLDELPTASLLDGRGNIDADAFPNFAELAGHATFARNHTTVAPYTIAAVPALLTGRMPSDREAVPTSVDHPENLFTLLGEDYDMHVIETMTHLCPTSVCERVEAVEGTPPPLVGLLREAVGVGRKRVEPVAVDDEPEFEFELGPTDSEAELRFEELAATFHAEPRKPGLHYLHVLLPHQAWVRLPDGKHYEAPSPPHGVFMNHVSQDPALAEVVRQRHLMQLAYTDVLLGELMDELKAAGTYDESLVIVTADHGVSFRPANPLRPLSDDNAADILWTPLIVKAPGQTEPQVLDHPTESVDVLPTIADLLGVELPWEVDGRSIFDDPRPDDWTRRAFHWRVNEAEPEADGFVHVDGPSGYREVLRSKPLDHGPEWDLRFWRRGRHGDLIGQRVAPMRGRDGPRVEVTLEGAERFDDVDLSADVVPAYLHGLVLDSPEPVDLALAVNGVVAAWFPADAVTLDGTSRPYYLLVPTSLLRDGDNELSLHVVRGTGDDRRLTPATVVER